MPMVVMIFQHVETITCARHFFFFKAFAFHHKFKPNQLVYHVFAMRDSSSDCGMIDMRLLPMDFSHCHPVVIVLLALFVPVERAAPQAPAAAHDAAKDKRASAVACTPNLLETYRDL